MFGFNFGETLGVLVEIIEPKIIDNKLKYLFFTEDVADFYFSNRGQGSIEILGRLVFSNQRVANQNATFFDEKYTQRKLNPHYDPTLPSYDINSITRGIFDNQKFINETKVVEGESTAIIIFMKAYSTHEAKPSRPE